MVKTRIFRKFAIDYEGMKTAAPSIPKIHFNNPRLAKVGVEVMTLKEVRERASPRLLSTAQRVDFHHLLLIQDGRARHMVDFIEHQLQPGSVLLVRPGQVQRWHMAEDLQGQITLISAQALTPELETSAMAKDLLALDQWPNLSRLNPRLFTEALADSSRLRAEINRFEGTSVDAAIILHEVLAMLLRLARVLCREAGNAEAAAQEGKIYRLFCRELEASFRTRPSVLDMARRIGFSESTLSRACLAAAGRSAKEVIDQRIALEAKRLLVHSKASIAEIAHELGFTEPTNFVKFFKRTALATPVAFRAGHRAA